ncbi:hypothetical protein GP486_006847, partial [Trichoglossum hirsutum]
VVRSLTKLISLRSLSPFAWDRSLMALNTLNWNWRYFLICREAALASRDLSAMKASCCWIMLSTVSIATS